MTQSMNVEMEQADEEIGAISRTSQSHHDRLWATLVERADQLMAAADAGTDYAASHGAFLGLLRGDMLAHLQAETEVIYAKLRAVGTVGLADSLEADHAVIVDLIDEVERAATPAVAARAARALVVLVALRIEKEEKIVLPALTEAGVDVNTLLAGVVVGMASDHDASFSYL